MTKETLKALQERYGMEILRDPITREAWALGLETKEDIPDLDEIITANKMPVVGTKEYGAYYAVNGTHYYKIVCPTAWFDLWGWR